MDSPDIKCHLRRMQVIIILTLTSKVYIGSLRQEGAEQLPPDKGSRYRPSNVLAEGIKCNQTLAWRSALPSKTELLLPEGRAERQARV